MAFQDNSGTIILDAVLTDVGRQKMVQGEFKVSKFLLGDDELDYSLVNLDTDNYDGVQDSPLFEAFASEAGDINYGLVSYPSDDVLYIPQIKVNTLLTESTLLHSAGDNHYFISANIETSRKIKDITSSNRFFLENYNFSNNKLIIESGIDKRSGNTIPSDKKSRQRFIINLGLLDKHFVISCDRRFFDNLLASREHDSYFNNDSAGNIYYNFEPLKEHKRKSVVKVLDEFESYIVTATDNHVYNHKGTGMDTKFSAFNGPRSSICALNLKLVDEITGDSTSTITDERFSIFGQTDQLVFGGSNKFDVIDTVIYIEGVSTSSRLQVPIKILRYSGT
tara:strand:+ start:261 stop:1268 length:1008 start_codon:yes stop_codon:yes gene_type:complete